MARNIRSNYYEDNYNRHECQSCKRSFIVGETLSENMNLSCPYCASPTIEWVASSTDETTEDMDLGCLGIHFSVYDGGELMLYTEREFAQAMEKNKIPMRTALEVMQEYCLSRDGAQKSGGNT